MADKKQLIPVLESRLKHLCKGVQLEWTPVKDNFSDWSRSITCLPGKDTCETLMTIFEIKNRGFVKKYNEATNGEGKEATRILTLHSSALLALLTFGNIADNKPLWIDNVEYTECWFEIKNRVFYKPSSIDVVLRSKDGNILFLESKFTEYLTASSSAFAIHYFKFYQEILPKINGEPLQMVYPRTYTYNDKKELGIGLQPKSPALIYDHLYMDGIKQCFSHLIGIAQGQVEGQDYECWHLSDKSKIKFATVLYQFRGNSFNSYAKFYNLVFGALKCKDFIGALANATNEDKAKFHTFDICPNVLTYQDIFKDERNSDFLPIKVKEFYRL